MSVSQKATQINTNRLLSVLPQAEYARLLPHLKQIHLKKGIVLYHTGDRVEDCYFPLNGMVSLLSTTEAGETVEVSMVSNEGMVGVPAILQTGVAPYEAMLQIEGDAVRIKAEILKKEFNQHGKLYSLLLRYTHALICQISQSAVCNRFHSVEQRLSRWLLISRDRVKSNSFPLTQEFIAHMLGAPRTSVTATAATLQQAEVIKYRRGQITIVDRKSLEKLSCECYGFVKNEIEGLYQ